MKIKYELSTNYMEENITVKDVFIAEKFDKRFIFPYRILVALCHEKIDELNTDFYFFDLYKNTSYYLNEYYLQIMDENGYYVRESFCFFSDPTVSCLGTDENINYVINYLKDCKNKDQQIPFGVLIRLQIYFKRLYKNALNEQYEKQQKLLEQQTNNT